MPADSTAVDISTLTLTYAEAAKRLGVTPRWLEDQVQHRRLPHHRFGRQVRFTENDITTILEDSRVRPLPRAKGA